MWATAAWSPGSTIPRNSVWPRSRQGKTLKRWASFFGTSGERLGLDRPQVDRGHAVGAGQRVGEPLLGDEAELVEARAEPAAVEHLVLDGLLQLPVGDDPAVAQDPSQYRQARLREPAILAAARRRRRAWPGPERPGYHARDRGPCPSPSPPTTSGSRTSSAS